ncbi:MAG: hypothetical protein LKJ25_03105 [Clostridia bacterium]|jgi:hypothetical protein|nr:hypothetical protein [Clostridia bacterium]
MTDAKTLLDAVNDALVKAYPETVVYIDRIPLNFKRPSFFIKYLTENQTSANMGMVHIEFYMTITIFGEKNKWYNTDTTELLELQSGVLSLFRSGKLKTSDGRSINIQASSGGSIEDEYYIDLQGEFYDSRETNTEYQLIEHVTNNIGLKE